MELFFPRIKLRQFSSIVVDSDSPMALTPKTRKMRWTSIWWEPLMPEALTVCGPSIANRYCCHLKSPALSAKYGKSLSQMWMESVRGHFINIIFIFQYISEPDRMLHIYFYCSIVIFIGMILVQFVIYPL